MALTTCAMKQTIDDSCVVPGHLQNWSRKSLILRRIKLNWKILEPISMTDPSLCQSSTTDMTDQWFFGNTDCTKLFCNDFDVIYLTEDEIHVRHPTLYMLL